MTGKRTHENGRNGSLESAMALLLQNQAEAVAECRRHDRELLALKKESDDRWVRIETLLLQRDRMLRELPEAIRQKIGFQQ